MEPGYYYSHEGQRLGPVPGEQLKQLAAAGQLQPTDLIWKEGMANWVPAAKVKGLFAAVAPQPPETPAATTTPARSGRVETTPNAHSNAANPEQTETAEAARALARQAKDAAMSASANAVKAFKVLVRNPVGGLREAFETLGPTPALGVGIVFAVVFVLCDLVGGLIGNGGIPVFSIFLKGMLVAVIWVAAAVGGCFAAQSLFRGKGGIQAAVFIAGASLLPLGAGFLLFGVLAKTFLVAGVAIISLTTTTLMIYSGCTTLLRLPDMVATFVVPLIFVVDALAFKLLLLGSWTGSPV